MPVIPSKSKCLSSRAKVNVCHPGRRPGIHPHLGLTIIDSPVVTYKDPKHAKNAEKEDLLDESVKDRFYAWLASRKELGQIIILENEEPNAETLPKLSYTEFVGPGNTTGRGGFFPV